jgi:hypothetical protein
MLLLSCDDVKVEILQFIPRQGEQYFPFLSWPSRASSITISQHSTNKMHFVLPQMFTLHHNTLNIATLSSAKWVIIREKYQIILRGTSVALYTSCARIEMEY